MENKMIAMFLLLMAKVMLGSSLLCDDVLNMPENKMLTLDELKTMQPMEINNCLAHLSKEKLPEAETNYLWKTILQYYNASGGSIPNKVLILLHWITPALTPADYANISLSSIEVVRNFGFNYNLNEGKISALAEKVREEYAGKEPEDYTYYDLTALRQILCGFNRTEIEKIQPSAYREAASVIGRLENCPPEVMLGFATLAVQDKAFGDPSKWSRATLEYVGSVSNFLPKQYRT